MAAPVYKGGRPFIKPGIRLPNSIVLAFQGAGAPTNGTSGTGAGVGGPGSIYIDRTAGAWYVNSNTKASPTWTIFDTAAGLALTSGHIFVGSASNLPADVAMSGDVTIDNTGATTIKTSVSLTTPNINVATATSINKVAITAPATAATLTILNNKTLTVNKSLTFDGTDSTTMTFPSTSATVARTDAGNTFTGNQAVTGSVLSSSASGGIGYSTGAGVAGVQTSTRTTTIAANGISGSLTLVSAAGSATPATFTVTNTSVVATDVIVINQKSGTDKYELFITAVGASSFNVTFFTTGGTTTEQPVFNFAVIKAVAS